MMVPIKMFLAGLVFSVLVSQASSQASPPAFPKLGCPAPEAPVTCPTPAFSCVPTKANWPDQFANKHRGSIYRKIRARSWWFCGKACDPTTPCKYWTYRHATRECYLMKTCCESAGDKAYQSGMAGCPTD